MRKVGGQGGPHDHLEEQQQIRDRQQVRDDAQKKKKKNGHCVAQTTTRHLRTRWEISFFPYHQGYA